jgi:hypothetical protein
MGTGEPSWPSATVQVHHGRQLLLRVTTALDVFEFAASPIKHRAAVVFSFLFFGRHHRLAPRCSSLPPLSRIQLKQPHHQVRPALARLLVRLH